MSIFQKRLLRYLHYVPVPVGEVKAELNCQSGKQTEAVPEALQVLKVRRCCIRYVAETQHVLLLA
jgi:hypothetical protein